MQVWPTKLRRNLDYVKWYVLGAHIIILGAIPMVLLMGLNIMTMKNMRRYKSSRIISRKSKKEREIQCKMAHFNMVIVTVFIICHSFVQIPSVYELINRLRGHENVTEWKFKNPIQTITEISQIMVVFNSSVNFYVYLIKLKLKHKKNKKQLPIHIISNVLAH